MNPIHEAIKDADGEMILWVARVRLPVSEGG